MDAGSSVVAPTLATAARHSSSLRILLVEDPSSSEAVIAEITRVCPGSLVERADSRQSYERALSELEPDVVLVDDALPWIDVRTALSLLQERLPAVPLIVLARALDEESVIGGLRAGAEDFVLMGNLRRLRAAVDRALSVRKPLRKLSPRQLDVLRLIAAGHTTPGIANRLERSPKTIETHRSEIMKRLGIHDVVGLVRYAIRVGLLPPEAQLR
jgi:DNA-binding NarL/FixJ family response regulator